MPSYNIEMPAEINAGRVGFTDNILIIVDSGDPGGAEGEFDLFMLDVLREWYDGAKVTLINTKNKSSISLCEGLG